MMLIGFVLENLNFLLKFNSVIVEILVAAALPSECY